MRQSYSKRLCLRRQSSPGQLPGPNRDRVWRKGSDEAENVLIAVKDIERSKQFCHDLSGLETIPDNDGNMILTEGLVLQEEKYIN